MNAFLIEAASAIPATGDKSMIIWVVVAVAAVAALVLVLTRKKK